MRPFLGGVFGNPWSLHWAGRKARAAVERARRQTADLFGAQPEEIVFTASGTESNNLAIFGAVEPSERQDKHVMTSSIEHPTVLEPCRQLERRGVEVTCLPVDGDGLVEPDDLRKALRPTTCLVSIMAANNVIGTLQPIMELARTTPDHGRFLTPMPCRPRAKSP